MTDMTRCLAPAAIATITIIGATIVHAAGGRPSQPNTYVITPLVSDLAGKAVFQDKVLRNAWGIAFAPGGSPFWVNDNATGCSTLYDGTGVKRGLRVSIPLPGNVVPSTDCRDVKPPPSPATPTGIIWNP
jgi:hypothetical protein